MFMIFIFIFRSKYDAKGVGPDGNAWKSVEAEQYKPPLKAEEDKQKVDVDPVWSEVDSKEPEQDWDEVYHKHRQELLQYLAPLSADYSADAVVRSIYSEPQKGADEVYHGEKQYSDVQTESEQKVGEDEAARVYLQPEEDKDALYHKDVQQLILQRAPKAAAPIDVPSPRRYSEPEEDLDDLYHRWTLTHKPTWADPRNPKTKQAKTLQRR